MEKPKLPNLTLPKNRSRSLEGHHLKKKTMMGFSPQCYIPSFVKIGPPVLEKILEGFYYIWALPPSWSCDPDAANKLSYPYPRGLHIKFGFDWACGFGEEDV